MYQPPHFREERQDVLHGLVRAHPLATVVTVADGRADANHIPLLLDAARGPHGTLIGHVARANALSKGSDGEALAIFQGIEGYVTPSWYETKRETGKVVPTWNYVVVHARGAMRIIDDAAWLRAHVEALTRRHEGERSDPWLVSDAPAPFIAAQLKGIVGLEIEIASLEGKWKVSQNRPAADRAGVASGLRAERGEASEMAALVERFGGS